MRIVWSAFRQTIREIWSDVMLIVIFFVPIMMGIAFRFEITYIDTYCCNRFHYDTFLGPYCYLFDLTILLVTPIMAAYAGVMVVLGELDNGIAHCLVVTPLGKRGYIFSKIGMISIFATIYGTLVMLTFHIAEIHVIEMILVSLTSLMLGVMISFFIVGFAHNKVEGLAFSKFSGFLLIGVIVPGLVNGNVKYVTAFLPTFWITEYVKTDNLYAYAVGLFLTILYTLLFYRKFEKKL